MEKVMLLFFLQTGICITLNAYCEEKKPQNVKTFTD